MPYKKKIIGIYKIQSKSHPERIYIGSAVNIYHRWSIHRSDFAKKKHSSPQFQRHYNKYGIEDLEFSIVAICDERDGLNVVDKVCWVEQCFIWAYRYENTNKPYFNASPTAGTPLGIKYPPEYGEKISKIMKGRKGHKMPDWFGTFLSERNKGNTYGKSNKGKHHSEETKRKLSIAHKGKKKPEEVRLRQIESIKKTLALKRSMKKNA